MKFLLLLFRFKMDESLLSFSKQVRLLSSKLPIAVEINLYFHLSSAFSSAEPFISDVPGRLFGFYFVVKHQIGLDAKWKSISRATILQ